MTITKKRRKNVVPQFAGIVVTASTLDEAKNRYRLAATGNDAQVLQSESGSYTLVTTSHDLEQTFHDVVSGEGNMVEIDAQLDSHSSGNQESVEAFMTVCADGCSNIIIADGEDVVSHCPSCSTAIPELSAEEIQELTAHESISSFDADYPQGHQGVIVSASSFEEAHDLYLETMSGENVKGIVDTSVDDLESQSGESELAFTTHSSCDITFSPYLGTESLSQDDDVVDSFTAESSTGDDDPSFAGHYLLCESSGCDAPHIISSKNEPVFCPSCSHGLVDPEDLANLEESNSSVIFEEDDLESGSGYIGGLDSESMDASEDDSEEDDSEDDVSEEDDSEDDVSEEDLDDLSDLDVEDDLDSESGDMSDEDLSDEDLSDDDEVSDVDIDIEDDDSEDDLDSQSTVEFELNLMEAVSATEGTLEPEHVFTAHCGNINGVDTVLAFYKSNPIATLCSNNVSATVSKIFNSPALGDAIKASITESGVEQGLTNIGFQAIIPDLDLDVAVSQSLLDRTDAKIDQVLASAQDREDGYAQRFEAALATAIMGINRNAFKGVSNPLHNQLVATLSAAGLKNPESIVAQAISNSSDLYAQTALAQAKELISKAPEVQNQIAESISNLNFLTESNSTPVETIGKLTPVLEPKQELESDSSVDTSIRTKVKLLKLGRR